MTYIFGLSTVRRAGNNYVVATLESLMNSLSAHEASKCLFLLSVAQSSPAPLESGTLPAPNATSGGGGGVGLGVGGGGAATVSFVHKDDDYVQLLLGQLSSKFAQQIELGLLEVLVVPYVLSSPYHPAVDNGKA